MKRNAGCRNLFPRRPVKTRPPREATMMLRAMLAATAAVLFLRTSPGASHERSERRPAAARQGRRGRHVVRAARRDREGDQGRHREGPPARRRDRGRAQGQARLLRGVRLPRQGGRRRDDQGHDLQHRVDDQADGRARRAAAAGTRQAADRRSAVEVFPEIRRDEGRGARPEGRDHHGDRAGKAADHAAPPDDAHLGSGLRRARQHRRAQALSGRQRHCRRNDDRR